MNTSQLSSIVGALAAIIIGGLGIYLQWFSPAEGTVFIISGLSILGVHTGGSVAGSLRDK